MAGSVRGPELKIDLPERQGPQRPSIAAMLLHWYTEQYEGTAHSESNIEKNVDVVATSLFCIATQTPRREGCGEGGKGRTCRTVAAKCLHCIARRCCPTLSRSKRTCPHQPLASPWSSTKRIARHNGCKIAASEGRSNWCAEMLKKNRWCPTVNHRLVQIPTPIRIRARTAAG